MQKEVKKNKGGRPKVHGKKMKSRVLDLIQNGKSLANIAAMEGLPTKSCMYDWIRDDDWFAYSYARAKQIQADYYSSQVIDMSKLMMARAMKGTATKEMIMATRVHADIIKWYTAKLAPKVYGQSFTLEADDGTSAPKQLKVEFKKIVKLDNNDIVLEKE